MSSTNRRAFAVASSICSRTCSKFSATEFTAKSKSPRFRFSTIAQAFKPGQCFAAGLVPLGTKERFYRLLTGLEPIGRLEAQCQNAGLFSEYEDSSLFAREALNQIFSGASEMSHPARGKNSSRKILPFFTV